MLGSFNRHHPFCVFHTFFLIALFYFVFTIFPLCHLCCHTKFSVFAFRLVAVDHLEASNCAIRSNNRLMTTIPIFFQLIQPRMRTNWTPLLIQPTFRFFLVQDQISSTRFPCTSGVSIDWTWGGSFSRLPLTLYSGSPELTVTSYPASPSLSSREC